MAFDEAITSPQTRLIRLDAISEFKFNSNMYKYAMPPSF